ncbi:hypothetical protein Ciccas_014141 [Cichlidogyrus casuarinus]|uniref:XK-related protein n=1 Tax=Cichlidogyrus casuarinus TaxID=1844966 RepID=A0ABD2PIX4_9PLAT
MGGKRSKIVEQNKQAWLFARVVFTLLGLAPLGRYVESILFSRRMVAFEAKHLKPEVIRAAANMDSGAAIPAGSLLSGVPGSHRGTGDSHFSLSETTLKKIRRVRRQFLRTEEDSASVAIASGVFGAAPFAVIQGFLLIYREVNLNRMTPTTSKSAFSLINLSPIVVTILINYILTIFWASCALCHLYPTRHYRSNVDFERGKATVPIGGLSILFLCRVVHLTMRMLCFSLFIARFSFWILVPVGISWLIVFAVQRITRFLQDRQSDVVHAHVRNPFCLIRSKAGESFTPTNSVEISDRSKIP